MAATFASIWQAVEENKEYHKQHTMSGSGNNGAQQALSTTSLLSQNTPTGKPGKRYPLWPLPQTAGAEEVQTSPAKKHNTVLIHKTEIIKMRQELAYKWGQDPCEIENKWNDLT